MPSIQAETGHPGRLGSLPTATLEDLNVKGPGYFAIDDAGDSPSLEWRALHLPDDFGGRTATDDIVSQNRDLNEGQHNFESYGPRIEYLKNEAEPYGYSLSEKSETDFRKFVLSTPHFRRGSLVLIDNGNLRAVWNDGKESRLGLQFLGDDMVQYVIFRRLESSRQLSRVAGRKTIGEVPRLIDAFDLHSLLRK